MKKFHVDFPVINEAGHKTSVVFDIVAANHREAHLMAFEAMRDDGEEIAGNPTITRADRMPELRPFAVQTLQQPAEGTVYVHSSDYIKARFLPGRNVVVAEARDLEDGRRIIATFQVAEFCRFWAEADVTGTAERGEAAFEALERAQFTHGAVVAFA